MNSSKQPKIQGQQPTCCDWLLCRIEGRKGSCWLVWDGYKNKAAKKMLRREAKRRRWQLTGSHRGMGQQEREKTAQLGNRVEQPLEPRRVWEQQCDMLNAEVMPTRPVQREVENKSKWYWDKPNHLNFTFSWRHIVHYPCNYLKHSFLFSWSSRAIWISRMTEK